MITDDYMTAAKWIRNCRRGLAFTGAGISVESGIPPFRGEDGLWNRYDPATFDISFFRSSPLESWGVMRDIFYTLFGKVRPNTAHYVLAAMEKAGLITGVITQNVDSLHFDAGSTNVYEFHGALRRLVCMDCHGSVRVEQVDLALLPPACHRCRGLLKPDAVFFGEPIPDGVHRSAVAAAEKADLLIIIGTTGEVAPANRIPSLARHNGARIIEVNTVPSLYTDGISHLFLRGNAAGTMARLMDAIESPG